MGWLVSWEYSIIVVLTQNCFLKGLKLKKCVHSLSQYLFVTAINSGKHPLNFIHVHVHIHISVHVNVHVCVYWPFTNLIWLHECQVYAYINNNTQPNCIHVHVHIHNYTGDSFIFLFYRRGTIYYSISCDNPGIYNIKVYQKG